MRWNRVAETTLPDGKWISTVQLGVPHHGGSFETMVFPKAGEWGELDCNRYYSEEQAKTGHEAMVAKWTARIGAPVEPTEAA